MSVPTCSKCGEEIPDPADQWPGTVARVCTTCWESEAAGDFWRTVNYVAGRLPVLAPGVVRGPASAGGPGRG